MSNYKQAIEVIRRLRERGFTALLAGGCVRDRLLGRTPSDFDVATNAVPQEVTKLFRRTLTVGAQFGVVMVLLGDKQVEVATFRTEGGYQDGRRPSQVAFCDAREDAARRDFTVNGMFYDPIEEKLYDFVGGQADIEAKVLRTIGSPEQRFSEDYLRMLRAVRFAVKLDFTIEPTTWRAICAFADKVAAISAERIAAELEEILTHPNRRRGAELLAESGLCRAIFPAFDDAAVRKGAAVLGYLPHSVDAASALAAFWAEVSTEKALGFCRRLKLSNTQTKHIRFLLEHRGVLRNADMPLSQLKLLAYEPYFEPLCLLEKAMLKAERKSPYALNEIRRRALQLDPQGIHPPPLLNGHTLMQMGASWPTLGRLARELYIAQLEEHLKTPEQAKEWAAQWLKAYRAAHDPQSLRVS